MNRLVPDHATNTQPTLCSLLYRATAAIDLSSTTEANLDKMQ